MVGDLRRAIAAALAGPLLLWPAAETAAQDISAGRAADRAVESWLNRPGAVERAADGQVLRVFDFAASEARSFLFPVTAERGLPDGWAPIDLTNRLGHPTHSAVADDLALLFRSAAQDGVSITIISGFRSASYQTVLFERAVQRQFERANGAIDRAEAEQRAARFVARPNHSQHQLGTAVDLSGPEIGYGIGREFAATTAAGWLARRSWEFGFVIPYTEAGTRETGYIYEPWHLRWVGRQLAELLEREGYQSSETLVVDRYLEAVERWLDRTGVE